MRLSLNFAVLLALLLSYSLAAKTASAECQCPASFSLEDALETATLVFTGQVKSIKELSTKAGYAEVKFSVIRKLKGFEEVQTPFVLIYTPQADPDCGVTFAEGMEYLVFATGTPAFFKTSTCLRTQILDDALLDVQKLIRMTRRQEEQP